MRFFESSSGKIVIISLGIVAVVVIAFLAKGVMAKGGTDSPSDVTNLIPKSNPNDPHRVSPRPGDAVGVIPTKPD